MIVGIDADLVPPPRLLRIFISSPADVNPERRRAALVIEKLAKDYARFFRIEFTLWETEPMLSSGSFQDAVIEPSKTDILVLILWSRLGTFLPDKTSKREYRGIGGRTPVTGTEWEFEDALSAHQVRKRPVLLSYRKTIDPKVPLKDRKAKAEAERQWGMLEAFWDRHFSSATRAFTPFEDLAAFETRFEHDLRQVIERQIAQGSSPSNLTANTWLKGSPFRGLESYRYEHAAIYFGRSEAVNAGVEQLLENCDSGRPFLLILAASGAGKSSLAQAGLVPALSLRGVVTGVGLWRRAVMRPGAHRSGLFDSLAESLVADDALPELLAPGQNVGDLARHLAAATEDASYPIVSALAMRERTAHEHGDLLSHEQGRLILVVDQLEELFTSNDLTPDLRKAFISCIEGLLRSGRIFVIATMRSDYWHRAAEVPRLVMLAEGRGRLDLLPATQSEIAEMIRRPAEAAGLTLESDPRTGISLDAALAEEAAREPGALPLLSFLLDALYSKDVLGNRKTVLSYASMRALGGLKGAIAQRAESVSTKLSEEVQRVLPKVLRALVTVSRSGAEPTSRGAPMSRFFEDSPERQLVDALLNPDTRLLVAHGDGAGARVRLAHEALITHWDRARHQIAQDRDDLRTRAAIEEAESEWRSAQPRERRGYLLRDPQLANAVDLASRWGDELSPEISDFIKLSHAASKAAARRRWVVAGGVMVSLACLAVASIGALYIAERQRSQALIAQSRFLARDARAATAAGDATSGALLSLAALPRKLDRPDRPLAKEAEYALEDAFFNIRERLILRGHSKAINHIAFSKDGSRLVTASADNTARVWDTKAGTLIVELRGHERSVVSAAFSPDGAQIVTASGDKTARVWNATTGSSIAALIGHSRDVRRAVYSADGKLILTASWDGTARIWKVGATTPPMVLQWDDEPLNTVAFSPDGLLVVAASEAGTARIWSTVDGKAVAALEGHKGAIRSVSLSPDSARIVTASDDRTSRLWSATDGRLISELRGHDNRVNSAVFSRDGLRILTASDDQTARLWDGQTGAEGTVLRGHENDVVFGSFSPDGRYVLTASDDQTLRVWNARTGAEVLVLRGHEKEIRTADFSPDGKRVVSGSEDTTARLWEIKASGEIVTLAHSKELVPAASSRDGGIILTASGTSAQLWDGMSGAKIGVLAEHDRDIISAALSPDGTTVITTSWDSTVRLWNAKTKREILLLKGHTDLTTDASFSHDSRMVVTASYDQSARVWNAQTGLVVAALRGHKARVNSAEFSPDGGRVVTASDDQTARIWTLTDVATITVLVGHDNRVTSARFSADGRRVVTGSDDSKVRVWDAKTGAPIAVLAGHESTITSAMFDPSGRRIVSSSHDRTARLWDADTGANVAILVHAGKVRSAQFSPDGVRILTASEDKTARLWDAADGAAGAVLRGHERAVTSARYLLHGKRIITTSDDTTARLWMTPPRCRPLIETTRSELPRELTRTEREKYFLLNDSTGESFGFYGFVRPLLAAFVAGTVDCSR